MEPNPIQLETFEHIFFLCALTTSYRDGFITRFVPELMNSSNEEKKMFWFHGILPGMVYPNLFISASVSLFNFGIWNMKLRKQLVAPSIFFRDLETDLLKTLRQSKRVRDDKNGSNFWLCRQNLRPP